MTGSRNQAETERARGFQWFPGFRTILISHFKVCPISKKRGGQGHTTRCRVQQCSLVIFAMALALCFGPGQSRSSHGGFRKVQGNYARTH